MPHTVQSFLKWLREYEPPRFDEFRYHDQDRKHIVGSLKAAVRLKVGSDQLPEDFFPLLHQIEDIAAAYIGLEQTIDKAGGWPSRTDQRKQLARLGGAKSLTVFRKAALALHPALWFSMALDDVALDWKHWRALLAANEIDPDVLMPHANAIRTAAQLALAALEEKKSKPGPKKHALHVWFARQLAPIYEETTGKPATAYHIEHKPGPFVRFVAACLNPLDGEVTESTLNDALYNQLFKAKR